MKATRENTAAKLDKLAAFVKATKTPAYHLKGFAESLDNHMKHIEEWTNDREDLNTIPEKDIKDIYTMCEDDARTLKMFLDKIDTLRNNISEALNELNQ